MLRRLTLSVALAAAALVSLSSVTLAYSAPIRVAPGAGSCNVDTSTQLVRAFPICTTVR
jgi:hypothetical protein